MLEWANGAGPDQTAPCRPRSDCTCVIRAYTARHSVHIFWTHRCTCMMIPYSNSYKTNEPRHDKTNKMSVRLAKTKISLGIRPVWSESSPCAQWVAKDPSFLHADSEDSDQTGRMPRLIWVFAGRTVTLLVLSCRSSNSGVPIFTNFTVI